MKTQWKKWFAVVAVASAAPASAIPVTFDFTGTIANVVDVDFATNMPVTDMSTVGQALSARFIVDTDLFGPGTSASTDVGDRLFFNSELAGAISSTFMINGESIDIAPYSRDRSTVSFLDSNGVVSCGTNCSRLAPDQFNVNLISDEFTIPQGSTVQRVASFSFVADFLGFENAEAAMSWFDLTPEFDINQLGSLEIPTTVRPSVILTDYTFACTEERCQTASSHRTLFAVTSTVRTVSSVPEPGTLGLLALGAAGVMLAGRRRRAVRT
jgi:hypothetical protein